jgi:hypothetical protein
MPPFFVVLTDVVLERARGLFVQDVEIEGRRRPGDQSSILRIRPGLRPHLQHFVGDFPRLFPRGEAPAAVSLIRRHFPE